MRTATIIIPKFDNDGSDNRPVIENTVRKFCEDFGGATVIDARGYWVNPEGQLFQDEVVKIESAGDPSAENNAKINAIADHILTETDQEAVFVSDFDGQVTIKD